MSLVERLLEPDAYDHPARRVELVQTHISWVLLAGRFAYKIKKPVRFGFLDYGTLARRKRACEREVELNRRTCPEAYLGVVAIVMRDGRPRLGGEGRAVEYAVKMRRLPAKGWLSTRIDEGAASAELLRAVARATQAFHEGAPTGARITRFGAAAAVRAVWQENLDELAPLTGGARASADLDAVAASGAAFQRRQARLIDDRAAAGRVRDGHGDLRADSVHVGDDGRICITDCIEFSDRLRCGDVAGDAAFLAMDLDFRGRADLADEFAGAYVALAWDDETLPFMMPFYRCHRAAVRAKVESLTARAPEMPPEQAGAARARAGRYLALARGYATGRTPPVLIAMGGLAGSGKSHIAAALAGRIGAVLVRSDAIRRRDFGATTRADGARYAPGARAAVYARARQIAAGHLRAQRPVVLDATHVARAERDGARALAAAHGVRFALAWVEAPERTARARLAARESAPGISEARWQTYLDQRAMLEPIAPDEPEGVIYLDGTRPVSENITQIVRATARR